MYHIALSDWNLYALQLIPKAGSQTGYASFLRLTIKTYPPDVSLADPMRQSSSLLSASFANKILPSRPSNPSTDDHQRNETT